LFGLDEFLTYMARSPLKILIVSTPRTGNTWLKFCLSLIYDLPVVEFPTPKLWRSFPVDQYDALGSRWIAHQHFHPFEPVVQWVQDRGVLLITTTRHPADTLLSLYHYVQNFAGKAQIDLETVRLLNPSDSSTKDETFCQEALQRYVHEKFFKALHFSIAWLQRDLSFGLRYEDLWNAPIDTLQALTDRLQPVAPRLIARAVDEASLEKMRKYAGNDALFFFRGGIGNWKATLPLNVAHMLNGLPPYPAQFKWLGYTLDLEGAAPMSSTHTSRYPPPANTLRFLPLDFVGPKGAISRDMYDWLNSPSERDSTRDQIPPVITNLGTYLYERRPDLQRAFPDIYGKDRVAFSHRFTEINFVGSQVLDPYFTVPVYTSWLTSRPPSFDPVYCPVQPARTLAQA
jgi:hypothetical protein